MSITIAELIKLSLDQPRVHALLHARPNLVSKYIHVASIMPELQTRISNFEEFYNNYDRIISIVRPHIDDIEFNLLNDYKTSICSVVLDVFDKITC